MSTSEFLNKRNSVSILNEVTRLVKEIERKVLSQNVKVKECEELKLLKEKCCDKNCVVSINAFHGMKYLLERKVIASSQTLSMLVSFLPSLTHYGAVVSLMGDILLCDVQAQVPQNENHVYSYSSQFQHPFIILLKYNWDKSWFEIYNFFLQLLQSNSKMKMCHKIEFLRPVLRYVFWICPRQSSELQQNLFHCLIVNSDEEEILNLALEALIWKEMDISYCLFLQDIFSFLLKRRNEKFSEIVGGLTPVLALSIKWLILNECNPCLALEILDNSLGISSVSNSVSLFMLSDVVVATPAAYINPLVSVCKNIVLSSHCNKYVAYKFIGVILNWFVSPSFLANPVYFEAEKVLEFLGDGSDKLKDETCKLVENKYFQIFGRSQKEVRLGVDFLSSWNDEEGNVLSWLANFRKSNEYEIQLKLCSFVLGILLCEDKQEIIGLCLDVLFKLIDRCKDISFPLMCLLFYKLTKESDPNLQKLYLFALPKLSVKKENISLIVGIIESLKRGSEKVMGPLVIQLYLALWQSDNRTYSYLHKMLHEASSKESSLELNISKAIALKEICRLSPHVHAKDLVGVLSGILNECSTGFSGLPSAIAIEAVTELCKAYVIDVAGTWKAIQPKLRLDKRPKVICSLCTFFGEIPKLNSSGHISEKLAEDIIPMLWNYTMFKDPAVVRSAFQALSNFHLESLPLKFLPEKYRIAIKLPKDWDKNSKTSEDLQNLDFVPAECWLQFLSKLEEPVLEDGGDLIKVLLERELVDLPRGLFYLPPEKAEPLSYSYLPWKSICRSLVDHLQKYTRERPDYGASYVKEIIRVLSFEYSKPLPPLNWEFLQNLMLINEQFSNVCLALMAKQGCVSNSARAILDNYIKSTDWKLKEVKDILSIYELLPHLSKSLSYTVLDCFLEQTINVCLEKSLNENEDWLEKLVEKATKTLKDPSVQLSHKNQIAKRLTRISTSIPPHHELMKSYAVCATEFPLKCVEEMTSFKGNPSTDVDLTWLERAVFIRTAIAMRSDIKNPLVWLNEFFEAAANFPGEKKLIMTTIWKVIRCRRECDHKNWLMELTWKIQGSITSGSPHKVTLFLVDVFVAAVVILAGFDCFFKDADTFVENDSKVLQMFPQAFSSLLAASHWTDMLPKVGQWLQKLTKWTHLSGSHITAFVEALFMLRQVKTFLNENEFSGLLHFYSVPIS